MISIIVPVCNVEKYLRQCLDSIINQTYKDLEIILVDDGSPDNCPAICDEYAKKDNRIKVIHKENGGIMTAWTEGLKLSTGEYIMFVDSDDWVEPSFIEKMKDACVDNNCDLGICGYFRNMSDKQASRPPTKIAFANMTGGGDIKIQDT